MTSFGAETYVNYKKQNEMPQWMKAERMEYCEQPTTKKLKASRVLSQILFSIFF